MLLVDSKGCHGIAPLYTYRLEADRRHCATVPTSSLTNSTICPAGNGVLHWMLDSWLKISPSLYAAARPSVTCFPMPSNHLEQARRNFLQYVCRTELKQNTLAESAKYSHWWTNECTSQLCRTNLFTPEPAIFCGERELVGSLTVRGRFCSGPEGT